MYVDLVFITAALAFLSTVTLTLTGFILKSVITQNVKLTLAIQQLGPFNVEVNEKRLIDLEADMTRNWQRWSQYDKDPK